MIVKKPVSGREVTRRLCYFDEVGVGQRVYCWERQWGPRGGAMARVSRQDMLVHVSSGGGQRQVVFSSTLSLISRTLSPHVNSTVSCLLLSLSLFSPLVWKVKPPIVCFHARTLSTWLNLTHQLRAFVFAIFLCFINLAFPGVWNPNLYIKTKLLVLKINRRIM